MAAESYTNAAMQHGTDTEPEARSAYEFYHGVTVEQVAFVPHPSIADAGCSPDGFVGDDGLVEDKMAPNTATHLETLLGQAVIPTKYEAQMQFQMACSGRQSWCDFVSYDPIECPERMRLFVKRIHRDESRRSPNWKPRLCLFCLKWRGRYLNSTSLYGHQEAGMRRGRDKLYWFGPI